MKEQQHIYDGGPAFPESYGDDRRNERGVSGGMTLRDYFAAKSAATLTQAVLDDKNRKTIRVLSMETGVTEATVIAHLAYEIADALIAFRSKPRE